jgi:hypothetical protein
VAANQTLAQAGTAAMIELASKLGVFKKYQIETVLVDTFDFATAAA